RPEFPHRVKHPVESVPHCRSGTGKMPVEIAERRASVDLVAVRECALALRASPHGGHGYSLAQLPRASQSMEAAFRHSSTHVPATLINQGRRPVDVEFRGQRPARTSAGAGSWRAAAGACRSLTPRADRAPATDMKAAAARAGPNPAISV